MNTSIVVVGMARTALGAMQGELSSLSAIQLGASAVEGALKDANISSSCVSELIMGCVLSAGIGQAPARQVARTAGLLNSCSATAVNKVCGSGMKSVSLAVQSLLLGNHDVVVAGGMESMSNAPYLMAKARGGYRLGHSDLLDSMFTDGLEDASSGQLMGLYADKTAEKYGITRQEQDNFAIESVRRAKYAQANGLFEKEIVPVAIESRKSRVYVDEDEQPKRSKVDKIPSLKPAFSKEGTVTAANASSIADGAAAMVLTTQEYAQENNLNILAQLTGFSEHSHEPEWFTTAPVGAIEKLMRAIGWSVQDIDLFEINEAFAVVPMAAMHDLNIPSQKVNVNGGACSLGHPLGASGARILISLIAALHLNKKDKGIASLCIGGGEAIAVAVERYQT